MLEDTLAPWFTRPAGKQTVTEVCSAFRPVPVASVPPIHRHLNRHQTSRLRGHLEHYNRH